MTPPLTYTHPNDDILPIIRVVQAGSCPQLTHLTLERTGIDTSPTMAQESANLVVSGSFGRLESLKMAGDESFKSEGIEALFPALLLHRPPIQLPNLCHLSFSCYQTILDQENSQMLREILKAGVFSHLESLSIRDDALGDNRLQPVFDGLAASSCKHLLK